MPKTLSDPGLPAPPIEPASSPHAAADMRAAAADAARVLRAIGSPRRLLILCFLLERPRTVTEICDAIAARQSLVSQHLTRLRRDGLVTVERRGHFADYSIADTVAKEIVETLYRRYCARDVVRPRK
jgi:DNA-binding transcriptional ArsR family regulator